MKIHIWKKLYKEDPALSAEYRPLRRRLAQAGLSEKALRKMTPQQRVQTLEKAKRDPYDVIGLAGCKAPQEQNICFRNYTTQSAPPLLTALPISRLDLYEK